MVWSLVLGCNEISLNPPPTEEVAPVWEASEETFVQAAAAGVDVLLVLDDTASMAQEQDALAALWDGWLADLVALDLGWQLSVVTTDMEIADAGWLRGSPYVLTPTTAERERVFGQMIDVGTAGLGAEAGFAAAITALDLAVDGPNSGFRRSDTGLHVVFVSDADDQSDAWLTEDPVQTFVARMDEEASRTGLSAQASAVVGPPPSGCSTATGSAQAGTRYVDAATWTAGAVIDICAIDLAPITSLLAAQAVAAVAEFPLQEVPVPNSLTVEVDEVEVDTWVLDASVPSIRFDEAPAHGSRITVRYLYEVAP